MKKVLFIYDDVWHPAEVIDRGLQTFGEELMGYEFDMVMTAKDILTPEMLKEYPLIVCCKGNAINAANSAPWFEEGVTEVMPKDFRKYVEEGGSFLAVHAANTFTKAGCPEMADLLGGSFVTHPPRCAVTVYPVSEHPIVRDLDAFTQRDEHYQLDLASDILKADQVEAPYGDKETSVFLKSYSVTGGTQIAGWTRKIGKGRLCCITPGHTLGVWSDPEFQKLFLNSMAWCLKEI